MSVSMWLVSFYVNVISSASETIRLANGTNSCSGRVELFYKGIWGTVCDDGWDLSDAAVVCRQMGCGDAIEAKTAAYFGPGIGWIFVSSVTCLGNESGLINCGFKTFGEFSCDHSKDAGVMCHSLVRLANGSDSCSGRVEVFNDGQWGTVCDDGWDLTDAAVVCKEMGCGDVFEQRGGGYFGQGSGPVWQSDVQCSNSDSTLRHCVLKDWGQNTCGHEKDAAVSCHNVVRLVSGSKSCSGRVEVLLNKQWGTVCDVGWDALDAAVVCRQLDCGTVLEVKGAAYFGQGSGMVWMTDVNCFGNESMLMSCSYTRSPTSCGHEKDAGVTCGYMKVVLRIEVKADVSVDPNAPEIQNKLSEEVLFAVIFWLFMLLLVADGKVFHEGKGTAP